MLRESQSLEWSPVHWSGLVALQWQHQNLSGSEHLFASRPCDMALEGGPCSMSSPHRDTNQWSPYVWNATEAGRECGMS